MKPLNFRPGRTPGKSYASFSIEETVALSSLLISPKSHSWLLSKSELEPCYPDLTSNASLNFISRLDMPQPQSSEQGDQTRPS